MSNRRITKEQFVNDGTIDGSRIQKALDETEEYINNVPLEAIKQRYSLNYMVFTALGAAGGDGATLGKTRFAPYLNSNNLVPGGNNDRVKGTTKASETLTPYTKALTYPSIFTVATSFPVPVIIDSVCLFINSRGRYGPGTLSDQSFEMLSGAASFQRTRIIVDTDDMVSSEDRTLNAKEYVLQDFQESFWSGTPQAAGSTMFPRSSEQTGAIPSWGGVGSSQSLLLRKDDLNIPVHQFARTRFRLVLYAGGVANPLRHRTPENMTLTVVYKEALRDG